MGAVITDISSDFLAFWQARDDQVGEISRIIWETLYVEPNKEIWDFYVRNHAPPQDLSEVWERYKTHVGHIRRVAAESHKVIQYATAICEASLGVSVPVNHILMVGCFTSNAWADLFRSAPTCFYALELIPDRDTLAMMAAHETTHVLHRSLGQLDFDRQNVAETLLLEGLATYGEVVAVPGQDDATYLWPGYDKTTALQPVSAWLNDCQENQAVLAAQLLPVVASVDEATKKRFFNANAQNAHPETPVRAGYYMGFCIVKYLLETSDLADIASLKKAERTDVVVKALQLLF